MKDIKYVEGMAICLKDSDEHICDIDSPARIDITCDFNVGEFCVCTEDCDFRGSLPAVEAERWNKNAV